MTDQPERIFETEDADADFEAHRLFGPEKTADITDVKLTNEDADADFEGHRFFGPEKAADPSGKTA